MCSANVRVFASLKGIGYHEGRKDKPDSIWSNPARTRQTATEDKKWKNPEKPQFFGVFEPL